MQCCMQISQFIEEIGGGGGLGRFKGEFCEGLNRE